ncbi:MAG: deoxyribodipyrimidine photo-lyase [Bacteroidota bacterium]
MYIPILAKIQDYTPLTLFWFRRDLRITDNHGLYQALTSHRHVLPIFIFDTNILAQLEEPTDRRINFIYEQIQTIHNTLQAYQSSLCVCYGNPIAIYRELVDKLQLQAVYANHDYEPYARKRDQDIHDLLVAHHIPFYTFKDQAIFEKDEIMKDDGKPYTVYTPYMKKWKATLQPNHTQPFDTLAHAKHFFKTTPLPLILHKDMGFQTQVYNFPPKVIDTQIIQQYGQQRDIPGRSGTSRLSVHFRFGTISIRQAIRVAQETNEVWLNELIWRDFYMMILWHFPYVVQRSFKPAYDAVAWANDEAKFQAWSEGRTGYPIVDAGMHELNQTGYMHNRLRMITASFLTKDLLIDWRWGEAYFGKKLLDYELSSNNGGWQWAAGSGCDAAPYFRIFNPTAQAQKFDPDLAYIKRWNPTFQDPDYPKPIVDHASAREQTLRAYRAALGSENWYKKPSKGVGKGTK